MYRCMYIGTLPYTCHHGQPPSYSNSKCCRQAFVLDWEMVSLHASCLPKIVATTLKHKYAYIKNMHTFTTVPSAP